MKPVHFSPVSRFIGQLSRYTLCRFGVLKIKEFASLSLELKNMVICYLVRLDLAGVLFYIILC